MSLLTATNALRLIGLIALGMLYPMPAHAGGVVSCELFFAVAQLP
jgi:hypothetical protein